MKSGQNNIKNLFFKYLPLILLFILTFAIYGKTVNYGITEVDDNTFIYGNAALYSSKTILKDIFTKDIYLGTGFTTYYRPILCLTFAFENKIAGTSTHFAHFTNILLHLIACFLIFLYFQKYLTQKIPAFIASVIFALHPANIYTVAWVPGRNDSLFFIFFILALIFLREYADNKKLIFAFLHIFFFQLLLFTKESAIIIPIIFVLYILTHTKTDKKDFLSYRFLIAVWCLQILFFIFLHQISITNPNSLLNSILKSFYLENFSMFFEYYSSMFFLTVPFAVNIKTQTFILGSVAMAFTVYLTFSCGKEKLKKFFYFILPFMFIAPTMPAGRIWYQGNRMYIPLFAVLALFFICLETIKSDKKKFINYIYTAIILLLLLCSLITSTKIDHFKNGVTFWSAVYKDAIKPSIVVQNLYTDSLLSYGYPDEAFPIIQKALSDSDHSSLSTVYNLANYYFLLGDYGKAGRYFEEAIENQVLADAETYANLFICAKFLANKDAAEFYYEKTSQKFDNSLDKTNEFIMQTMKKLEDTRYAYNERKSENKANTVYE